jgi:hypothetical protein
MDIIPIRPESGDLPIFSRGLAGGSGVDFGAPIHHDQLARQFKTITSETGLRGELLMGYLAEKQWCWTGPWPAVHNEERSHYACVHVGRRCPSNIASHGWPLGSLDRHRDIVSAETAAQTIGTGYGEIEQQRVNAVSAREPQI